MLSRILAASSSSATVVRSSAMATRTSALAAIFTRSSAAPIFRSYSAESDVPQASQDRPRRQFDGERRPPRQFDGERRPPRQFDGERRPTRQFDGERRPPRQNDGERRPPRQFNSAGGQPLTDLDKFRDRVANGNSINAWKLYQPLATNQLDTLTFMDHVKLMGLFRLSSLGPDFERMRIIFSNLERAQLDIPAPIYETMISKAWRFSPELTEEYYGKLVAKHGAADVSPLTWASRMNAYRSAKQFDKVFDLAREAEQAGINTHQLLPIVMDAYWHKGDEAMATKLFEAYVSREGQNLNLCKIHAWMANNLLDKGRMDEARKLIDRLAEREIRLSSGAFGVLARIAIMEGNLAEARNQASEAIRTSRRETYTHVVTTVVDAHLRAKDLAGLHEFLKVYTAKYEEIPNQRFRPYMQLIDHHAKTDKDVVAIRAVFDMIPTPSKLNNPAILKCMLEAYVKADHPDKARQLLAAAHRHRFSETHAVVNQQWLESFILNSQQGKTGAATTAPKPEEAKPAASPAAPAAPAAATPVAPKVESADKSGAAANAADASAPATKATEGTKA